MHLNISISKIKERCGEVSFKKGDTFYRKGKVNIESTSLTSIRATVRGKEYFDVMIRKDDNGNIHTSCNCPKLASYDKDCQHIAAVLLSVRRNKELADDILELFEEPVETYTGYLQYFESRQRLNLIFLVKAIPIQNDDHVFGVSLKLNKIMIKDIIEFLDHLENGKLYKEDKKIIYDPRRHSFDKKTDRVLRELMRIKKDKKTLLDSENFKRKKELIIPTLLWDVFIDLFESAPTVFIEYEGKTYKSFQVSKEKLPLSFSFGDGENEGEYQLTIHGLERTLVLPSYQTALLDGKIVLLKRDDSKRIYELKRLFHISGTKQIPIPERQLKHYMEKLLPAFRKLGEVYFSGRITDEIEKTPLTAKLYLDRIRGRFLAGLEFQYDNIVINPLEKRQVEIGAMIIRDIEKETEILHLMDSCQFYKTESGYFIENEELEYDFLYHKLPQLHKRLQVYATTAVRTRILPKTTIPKIKVKHKKERLNWLEFKFDLDGIPEKEIRNVLQALEEKRKYYRLKEGTLLSLETKEFEEIRRFIHTVPEQIDELEKGLEVPVIQGLRLLDVTNESSTIHIDDTFQSFLNSISNPDINDFPVPKQLQGVLRNYQIKGFRWLKSLARFGFGGILADDMGLGKTLQSITFIVSELHSIRKGNPVLIVCPASVTYNWFNELNKFAPEIQTKVVDGQKSDRYHRFKDMEEVDVLITSYPLLRSDIDWYKKQKFHTIFFDEAQSFKNPLTQTARTVKKLKANHLFALTGTPMENNLEELWSIFHVVFPELFLGLREYSELTKKQISRRIQPFMLRRVKADVLKEIPKKMESIEHIELLPEQKKLYASYLAKLRHDTFKHLDKDTIRKNKIRILAGLTRLRQICCHPALFVDGYNGTSAKFLLLKKIMVEAKASNRKVLIFSQFTKMLKMIGKELAYHGDTFFFLDGNTPSEERVQLCDRFNTGERNFFLISLKAGGTGLNLTGADTVIFYDSWWNPAVEEQAADRAHRMGQRHTVKVIKLVSKGTVEEKMNKLQEMKRQLIDEIIDTEDKTTTLSIEDIRELLME